jgi:hypothetical protein
VYVLLSPGSMNQDFFIFRPLRKLVIILQDE